MLCHSIEGTDASPSCRPTKRLRTSSDFVCEALATPTIFIPSSLSFEIETSPSAPKAEHKGETEWTVVMRAAARGQVETVISLMQSGSDIRQIVNGQTAATIASDKFEQTGRLEYLKILDLFHDFEISKTDEEYLNLDAYVNHPINKQKMRIELSLSQCCRAPGCDNPVVIPYHHCAGRDRCANSMRIQHRLQVPDELIGLLVVCGGKPRRLRDKKDMTEYLLSQRCASNSSYPATLRDVFCSKVSKPRKYSSTSLTPNPKTLPDATTNVFELDNRG
jgi:hypothetical protein